MSPTTLRRVFRRLESESGYSLVEVIASIMLLSIAIIPMVGMFDVGLRAASTSGNYDKARSFANQRLENAKSLASSSYTSFKSDDFPSGTTPSSCGAGCRRYEDSTPASAGLPAGSTYTLEKLYLDQPETDPGGPSASINPSSSDGTADDEGLIRITLTVNWSSASSYTTWGVVAG